MIRVGLVGFGYWGPNLARNLMEVSGAKLGAICDFRSDRLSLAAGRYPSVTATNKFSDIADDPRIDAVVIATPVCSHFELAMKAMRAGKHVLIEKPLASNSEEALQLIEEASRLKRLLMVGHTFVYSGAVQKMKELADKADLGELYYYDSVRVNLGLFQHDINVIWDLAVHDLAIMDYVLPFRPVAVLATGLNHFVGRPENIAYLSFYFKQPMVAHLHVNWLAPVKVRRTLLSGSRKMIVYDDLEPSEKIKVYDRGVTVTSDPDAVYKMQVGYRTGDMWAPHLETVEPLRVEVQHFIDCIEKNQESLTCGEAGYRVIRMLEAANCSLAQKGRLVELN